MNDTTKKRKYSSINISHETKTRADGVYYSLKIKNKFKSSDDFINWLLDKVDK